MSNGTRGAAAFWNTFHFLQRQESALVALPHTYNYSTRPMDRQDQIRELCEVGQQFRSKQGLASHSRVAEMASAEVFSLKYVPSIGQDIDGCRIT